MRASALLFFFCLFLLPARNPARAADAENGIPDPPRLYLPVAGEFSSPFGQRPVFRWRGSRMHKGIDISAGIGSPVCAAAPGKVIFAGVRGGYGLMVEIDHGQGVRTRYAHLDSCALAVGGLVETGDRIGTVGKSGRTTGPNLHFETIIRGRSVDPLPLLGVDWQPPRFRRLSPVMRPRPGVFARFTPPPSGETLLAPMTIRPRPSGASR